MNDEARFRTAHHQLDIGPKDSKAKFTKDQLAAAGLGSGPAPQQQHELVVEQGTGEPLLGLDGLESDPRQYPEAPAGYDQYMGQYRPTSEPQPPSPVPPQPAGPVADPQMQMMQQLMQQNAMLQQQLMQLTQELTRRPAQPQVDHDQERARREARMRDGNLSREQSEKVLYGGHGLIG